MKIKTVVLTLLLLSCGLAVDAKIIRSHAVLLEFRKHNVCPATGQLAVYTSCHGYVIDHIKPLCAGGKDELQNLQWQEYAASKKKDLLEMKMCRKIAACIANQAK